MKTEEVNAISTALISFITVLSLMTGFYFSMKSLNISLFYTILFEVIFLFIIISFILWVIGVIKYES